MKPAAMSSEAYLDVVGRFLGEEQTDAFHRGREAGLASSAWFGR
jgi:hypothetical protein